MTKTKGNILCSMILIFYYLSYVLLFDFVLPYLEAMGCSSTQSGLLLGSSYVLAFVLQQAFASFIKKTKINLGKATAVLFGAVLLLSAVMLLFKAYNLLFFMIIFLARIIVAMLQPTSEVLHRGYSNQGLKINFPIARGLGSGAYALGAIVFGKLFEVYSAKLTPVFCIIAAAGMVVSVLLFNPPNFEDEPATSDLKKSNGSFFKEYKDFLLLFVGTIFMAAPFSFSMVFMLKIMQTVGGDSSHAGIALFINSFVQVPAMFLYKKISNKTGNRNLIVLSGWACALKTICILFGISIEVIYVLSIFEFLGYPLYVVAINRHVAHALPASEALKGQSLLTGAFTAGSAIMAILGGTIIDLFGMRTSMIVMQVIALISSIIIPFSMYMSYKKDPAPKKVEAVAK